MNRFVKTQYFNNWLESLRDSRARAKIIRRIERAAEGNFGDHKSVAGGIWEMRIDYGPGYRLYYARQGGTVYVLLCGGDKTSQQEDINLAGEMWREIHG